VICFSFFYDKSDKFPSIINTHNNPDIASNIGEIIRHLCIGQSRMCNIYIPPEKGIVFSEVLVQFLLLQPPPLYSPVKKVPNAVLYRIDLYSLLQSLSKTIPIDFSGYYLLELKLIGKKWSDSLHNYLVVNFETNEKNLKLLCESLLSLQNTNMPLLRAILNVVGKLLKNIGPKNYIPYLGVGSFNFISSIDQTFLEFFPKNMISSSNIDSFLQFPNVLFDQHATKLFQSLFACGEPFPSPSKLFKESSIITLINDTLLKKKAFFDLIFSKTRSFVHSDEKSKVLSITEDFPELRPWCFISEFDTLYSDDIRFKESLVFFSSSSFPLQIYDRLLNDFELVITLRQLLGQVIVFHDLSYSSIPALIRPTISSVELDLLSNLSEKSYFVYSDIDRDLDFSFIYIYRMLFDMLKYIESPSEETIDFSQYLNLIKSESWFHGVTTDLFSLVFLQNNKGEFIMPLSMAEQIITSIIPYSDKSTLPYLSSTMSRIQLTRHLGLSGLDSCFISITDAVLAAFRKSEFALAEKISFQQPSLFKLSHIGHALHCYRNDQPPNVKNEFLEAYEIEKSFSLSGPYPRNLDIILNQVIEKRNEMNGHQLLDIVGSRQYYRDMINQSYQCIQELSLPLEHIKRFSFLSGFIHYHSLCKSSIGNSQVNNPSDILTNILSNDKALDYDSLQILLGTDAVEKILSYSISNSTIISMMDEISPIVSKALQYKGGFSNMEIIEQYSYLFPNSKVKRLLIDSLLFDIKQAQTESDLISIFDSYNQNLHFVHKDIFVVSLLDRALCIKPTPMSFLIEFKLFVPDLFNDKKDYIYNCLTFLNYYHLYPEFETKGLSLAIENGVYSKDSSEIIEHLLDSGKSRLSMSYSFLSASTTIFFEKLTSKVLKFQNDLSELHNVFLDIEFLIPIIIQRLENPPFNLIISLHNIHYKSDIVIPTNDDDCIQILESNSNIQCDEIIMNHIKKALEVSDLDVYFVTFELIKRFLTISKNVISIIGAITSRLFSAIENIKINSTKDEHRAIMSIQQSISILHRMKDFVNKNTTLPFPYEIQMSQLNCIYRFLNLHLFCKHDIRFNLNGFQTKEFSYKMCSECANYDQFQLIIDIKSVWDCDISEWMLSRSIICSLLGYNNEIGHLSSLNNPVSYIGSSSGTAVAAAVRVLSYPVPFVVVKNGKNIHDIIVDTCYSRAKNIFSGKGGLLGKQHQPEALSDIVLLYAGQSEHVVFSSAIGNFSDAFNSWDMLPTTQKNTINFVRTIMFPSMANAHWNRLWRHIKKLSDSIPEYLLFLEGVFDFLRKNSLIRMLSDIYIHMGLFEDAILTLVQLISQRESWDSKLCDLTLLVEILQKESNKRRDFSCTKKITDAGLRNLIHLSGLQCLFCRLCTDESLSFDPNLDLISSKNPLIGKMATISIKYLRFNLGLQIIELQPQMIISVVENLVEELNNEGSGTIPRFFSAMKKKLDQMNYEKLSTEIVMVIANRAASRLYIPKFIISNIHGDRFKIVLLLKLEFYDEAIIIAEKNGSKDDAYLILREAQRMRRQDLQAKCMKIINN